MVVEAAVARGCVVPKRCVEPFRCQETEYLHPPYLCTLCNYEREALYHIWLECNRQAIMGNVNQRKSVDWPKHTEKTVNKYPGPKKHTKSQACVYNWNLVTKYSLCHLGSCSCVYMWPHNTGDNFTNKIPPLVSWLYVSDYNVYFLKLHRETSTSLIVFDINIFVTGANFTVSCMFIECKCIANCLKAKWH